MSMRKYNKNPQQIANTHGLPWRKKLNLTSYHGEGSMEGFTRPNILCFTSSVGLPLPSD